MKSNLTFLTITLLAAFAVVGCHQASSSDATDSSVTNSNANYTNVMSAIPTNLPDMTTNTLTGTNASAR
jgi:hypothetical protein